MHAVVRNYTGAPGFADELNKHQKDIESLIGTVPGFIAYYLMKTSDGATSVTICQSRAGCAETNQRAAEWIRTNLPRLQVSAPQIIDGSVLFNFEQTGATREPAAQPPGVRH